MPIMDSLSKLAKSVGDGAKTAVKKSEDMVEISKLNRSISNEEDRIKLTYNEMGKIIYSKYQKNEIIEEDLIEFCNKVDEFEKNISSIKQKIAEIKNVRICSNCGSEVELSTEICVKCGAKQELEHIGKNEIETNIEVEPPKEMVQVEMNEIDTNIEAVPTQEVLISKPKFCSACGKKVVDDSKFCQECGARL